MKKIIISLALVLTALPLCGCVMHVSHRTERKSSFVIKATFTKSPFKGEPLPN